MSKDVKERLAEGKRLEAEFLRMEARDREHREKEIANLEWGMTAYSRADVKKYEEACNDLGHEGLGFHIETRAAQEALSAWEIKMIEDGLGDFIPTIRVL